MVALTESHTGEHLSFLDNSAFCAKRAACITHRNIIYLLTCLSSTICKSHHHLAMRAQQSILIS
ncbi:hypothetical protein M758_10G061100 [Ceratodon purpureus]|nr:hypothetical protein M758_10G060300 [Ceratodon purpureus]KAG0603032.1 hypothetical protein M758_10G060500 [Ceratodon purpureus]KAG0603034.1 hypothetical protein M758_10G060700 [Ceratodon purpureus]KAG0603036.1 hypothetical protein M758_10G060900 [Ceratodon purpureus]KAG0603038.1 hypothetical protein M758_10G061100 [Ceratodon purpureus]